MAETAESSSPEPKKTTKKKAAAKKKASKRKAPKKKATKKVKNRKKAKKKASKRSSKKSGKRAGPGAAWTHTTPAEIMEFRERHGLPESHTAKLFSVSVGTLRNWTKHGKSAMASKQLQVKKAMENYDPNNAPAPKRGRKPGRPKKKAAVASSDMDSIARELIQRAVADPDPRPLLEAALRLLQ